ncbi:MAG: alpha/beta hydrolase [Solirubrobacterales bacterium]
MVLKTHQWGSAESPDIVCIHGVGQHGGVFEPLGRHLVGLGHSVVAVDLRGHGASDREPPWTTDVNAQDVLDTFDSLGIQRAAVVGHSFGGRVAAALAASAPDRVTRLALLDPGLGVPPERALKSAEIERLDWSFATVDGAVNALLSSESMVAPPRDVVEAYVRDDVRKGPDGRYRFRFCPSAAVVAWSEVVLPPPPIADVPTLFIRASTSILEGDVQERRYREALDGELTVVSVPHGHNVLWESPDETTEAIGQFVTVDGDMAGG